MMHAYVIRRGTLVPVGDSAQTIHVKAYICRKSYNRLEIRGVEHRGNQSLQVCFPASNTADPRRIQSEYEQGCKATRVQGASPEFACLCHICSASCPLDGGAGWLLSPKRNLPTNAVSPFTILAGPRRHRPPIAFSFLFVPRYINPPNSSLCNFSLLLRSFPGPCD